MTHEELAELQKRLVKTIVDFGKEKNLGMEEIERIDFYLDYPSCSIEFGDWHPGSDSSITTSKGREVLDYVM